jgi:hypothetical protein
MSTRRYGRAATPKFPALIAEEDKEQVINEAHAAVMEAGLAWSRSRVRRLVNQWDHRVRHNGWSLGDFILNRAQLDEQQRRKIESNQDWVKVTAYADPTGDTAVRRVMRVRARVTN